MKNIVIVSVSALLMALVLFFLIRGADQEAVPELTLIDSYNAQSGEEVTGLALIETQTDWIRVYEDEKYTLKEDGVINTYEGNNEGLDVEYKRLVAEKKDSEEIAELALLKTFNANAGDVIQGHALVQIGNDLIKVYASEEYTMPENGHVNTYHGNKLGLDNEYESVLGAMTEVEMVPELTWEEGYGAPEGEKVNGLALIDMGEEWIKVYAGDTHTMLADGYVHKYNGNRAGLDAEYERMQSL